MRQKASENPEDRLRNIEAGLTRAREVSLSFNASLYFHCIFLVNL